MVEGYEEHKAYCKLRGLKGIYSIGNVFWVTKNMKLKVFWRHLIESEHQNKWWDKEENITNKAESKKITK